MMRAPPATVQSCQFSHKNVGFPQMHGALSGVLGERVCSCSSIISDWSQGTDLTANSKTPRKLPQSLRRDVGAIGNAIGVRTLNNAMLFTKPGSAFQFYSICTRGRGTKWCPKFARYPISHYDKIRRHGLSGGPNYNRNH